MNIPTETKRLKVAIVHDFLFKLGGAEKLLLEILKIYPEADIYTLFYDQKQTKGLFNKFKVTHSALQKKTSAPKSFKLLLPKFPKAIESFDLSGYDLVISHSNSFAHGVITSPKTKHICYCLSPTRYLYDWKNEYLEENNLGTGIRGSLAQKVTHDLRVWDQQAETRPDKYIAISETVRSRIRKYYRLDAEVVYPAVDVEKIEPNFSERQDYYLIVSRLTAYKKIDLGIKAFNKLGKHLVIIGVGDDEHRLKALALDNIEFIGWQSDNSVMEYMRNAKAFVFPGEEDFGLTPIESMATGTPVIAYNKGGVTETVRAGIDGLLFNENNVQSLVEAVMNFENSSDIFDPEEIRKHAETFSVANFQKHFKEVVEADT